ncbi:MAG TPA: hypothetical protein VGO50_02020 [Pyrinomonadaceae bacterium]|nr:hypothetical protein [Pyrinomonadaceae bacterium]
MPDSIFMEGSSEENYNLENFLICLSKILNDVYEGRRLLFRITFRNYLENAWEDIGQIENQDNMSGIFSTVYKNTRRNFRKRLHSVGLEDGSSQSKLKLLGFFETYNEYEAKAGVWRLKDALEIAKMVLGSLGKVIPGVEILKELVEAILFGIQKAERGSQ